MLPRWQNTLFLTLLPLTRRTTNSYSKTRHHWENPRTQEWNESTSDPTEIKTEWIRRVREGAMHWLWPLQWVKRPRGSSQSPPAALGLFCGSPYSDFVPLGLQGSLWLSATGIGLWERMGEGLATTSTWILADWVHTCSGQVLIPASGFAHLQS